MTTKVTSIYIKKSKGCVILLFSQVADFCKRCTGEQDAKNICYMIGTKIKFQSKCDKGDVSFEYLGLVMDFNRTDLVQTKKYIGINCSNSIIHFLKSNGKDFVSD